MIRRLCGLLRDLRETKMSRHQALMGLARTQEQLWKDPDWTCAHCQFVNFAIRQNCRNCGCCRNAEQARQASQTESRVAL